MTMWKLLFVKTAAVTLAALAGAASARAQALPGGFVFLRDIDPAILQDIRYAGAEQFRRPRRLRVTTRPNAW